MRIQEKETSQAPSPRILTKFRLGGDGTDALGRALEFDVRPTRKQVLDQRMWGSKEAACLLLGDLPTVREKFLLVDQPGSEHNRVHGLILDAIRSGEIPPGRVSHDGKGIRIHAATLRQWWKRILKRDLPPWMRPDAERSEMRWADRNDVREQAMQHARHYRAVLAHHATREEIARYLHDRLRVTFGNGRRVSLKVLRQYVTDAFPAGTFKPGRPRKTPRK